MCIFFLMIQGKIIAQDIQVNNTQKNFDYFQESNQRNDSSQILWVKRYASNLRPSDDNASAMAVDRLGNIYVTGKSDSTFTAFDYLTVKYNVNGIIQWTARYDGGRNADDIPTAIAVDDEGNVIVTGRSYGGSETSFDYCTIKYDSNGVQQWCSKFNGNANNPDIPTTVAIDRSGNIIISGYVNRLGIHFDYATIKYDKNGNQIWLTYYNGPADDYDLVSDCAIDDSNNVYITGYSRGVNSDYDYATIKYNEDGIEQWVARYNGPGNSYDQAFCIKLDNARNVYITGGGTELTSSRDYTTIKYDNNGIQQWIAEYNGPGNSDDYAFDLVLDDSSNVYITGKSPGAGTNSDCATIKYDSNGIEQWVARYNGSGNTYDFAEGITLDDSQNVVITGYSTDNTSVNVIIIKYDMNGNEQWIRQHSGSSFAIRTDSKGGLNIVGIVSTLETLDDYLILKYKSDGVLILDEHLDGSGNSMDYATSCDIDKNGNVYVTGESYTGNGSVFTTFKYNTQGDLQWVKHYQDTNSTAYSNTPYSIKIDNQGYIYVLGKCTDIPSLTTNYVVIKYNSSGEEQWITKYTASEDFFVPRDLLTVDSSGNVYISVTSQEDYMTIKYNSNGEQQWATHYDPFSGSIDGPMGIAVDISGNVYVTGRSSARSATIKYNSNGIEQWAIRYEDSTSSPNSPKAIAIDNRGNVVLVGSIKSNLSTDYLTLKYDTSGNLSWVRRYNGDADSTDGAIGIIIDTSNNIYVTGKSVGIGTSTDFVTIKYNSEGVEAWIARYNGVENGIDEPASIAIDKYGDIYVTGKNMGSGSTFDMTTMKYDSEGNIQWVTSYNDLIPTQSEAKAIKVDDSDNVYVVGTSNHSSWNFFTTIKYRQNLVSVDDKVIILPNRYSLMQNYPNPFNPGTTINFDLPKQSNVSLKLYDITGREVATILEGMYAAGSYSIPFNASNLSSGVYFYKLIAGEYFSVRKLILLK